MVRIGIVVSEFNKEITGRMLEAAKKCAKKNGAQVVDVVAVPGAYDAPLAAKQMLVRNDVDAIVAIGCVLKGETKHDEVIMNSVASALTLLSLQFNKPVALGISGPGINEKQAKARIDEYAKRSVIAAIKMVGVLKK